MKKRGDEDEDENGEKERKERQKEDGKLNANLYFQPRNIFTSRL